MKKFVAAINLPVFIFGSIIIFVAGAIALFVVLNPVQAQGIVDLVKRPFSVDHLSSGSTVEVYQEQSMLKIKFHLNEEDKNQFIILSEKLGVSNEWQKGLSFGLDTESMSQISSYLPLKTAVSVEGNVIKLAGSSFNFMPSGGVGDEINFATDGASFRYAGGKTEASLVMNQPASLVSYATASGKINVSRKIESELFSLAGKVDTIDVHIKGKSLEGKIILK